MFIPFSSYPSALRKDEWTPVLICRQMPKQGAIRHPLVLTTKSTPLWWQNADKQSSRLPGIGVSGKVKNVYDRVMTRLWGWSQLAQC